MRDTYPSCEHRIIDRYIDMLPDFHPAADMDADSQRALYQMISDLLNNLYENPGILMPKLHDDGVFHVRANKSSENKPDLYKQMRDCIKAVDELIGLLNDMPRLGTVSGDLLTLPKTRKVTKRQLDALKTIGIDCAANKDCYVFDISAVRAALPVWHAMAGKSNVEFGRCAFDGDFDYLSGVYARLLGDAAAYDKIVEYVSGRGYKRGMWRDGIGTLDYTLELGKKESPVKDAWAERTHTGIECKCDMLMDNMAAISLRLPNFAEMLRRIGEADPAAREFMLGCVKKCDGCRFCVQTDKTGTRPLSAIAAEYKGETAKFCPLFPGFSFCFTKLDEGISEGFIAMMKFAEGLFGAE